jgi:hypothetical protein
VNPALSGASTPVFDRTSLPTPRRLRRPISWLCEFPFNRYTFLPIRVGAA